MIAFGRSYTLTTDDKKDEYMDLFTDKKIARYKKDEHGKWSVLSDHENMLGKIPIVYYSQDDVDWSDVQKIIERLENLLSNFADTNDYFGSPMVKIKGTVTGFAEKEDTGKVITITENGDADYLTWDQSPESTKLEIETLQNLIYSLTQTPDISFKSVQGMSNISGIALKLMFLDAYLKATEKAEVFEQAITRRLSILSAYSRLFNQSLKSTEGIDLECVITPYIPENIKEVVDMLSGATGGKAIVSRETAISIAGMADDVQDEISKIKSDETENIGGTFQ